MKLTKLKVAEVSLVGVPANRRRFLLTKSMTEEGSDDMDGDVMSALMESLKLLSPFRDKGCSDLVMGMEKMAAGEEWPFMLKMTPTPGDVHVGSTELDKGEADPPDDTSIVKEDDARMDDKKIDLTTLPPEVKEQIDQLFKSQEEAIKKAEALEASLNEEKDKRLTEEALAIAKGFSHLPIKPEDFAKVIKELKATAPGSWAEVEKALTAADKVIAEGKLFEEIGSGARTTVSSIMGKINAMADGIIQKSEIKLTREQAIDKVLKDNPALYNDYLAELGQ